MPASAGKHTVKAGYVAPHPSLRRNCLDVVGFVQQQEAATAEDYLASVRAAAPIHQKPRKLFELLAWWWLLAVRSVVGLLTGTFGGTHCASERQLARRAQMFNCDGQGTALSGVLLNHARSVVLNRPDNGWVHTLLMEIDCMRNQHAVWTELEAPTVFERAFDLLLTLNLLSQCCVVYLLAPSIIHSYQVYRAEEDIWWLSSMLIMLDQPGRLPRWEKATAPAAARAFYALPADAKIRDVLLRMLADELSIRDVNHRLAGLAPGTRTDAVAVGQFGG